MSRRGKPFRSRYAASAETPETIVAIQSSLSSYVNETFAKASESTGVGSRGSSSDRQAM